MQLYRAKLLLFSLLLISHFCNASDTLTLTIQEADKRFLEHNLELLSSQYGIDLQEAHIIQAKIYPTPSFTADLNVYNPSNHQFIDIGKDGQKSFMLEQLIILGGKRRTQIEITKKQSRIASLELEELLRNLRYKLHCSLYICNQQLTILNKFNEQLTLLDTIIKSYETQAPKGNIAAKEVVRLKSVYFKINNERADVLTSYNEEIRNLRILLNTTDYIVPVVEKYDNQKVNKVIFQNDLLDIAMQNRPDVKIQAQQSDMSDLNLRLQQQNRIPDIVVNGSYDQRSGAFNNQINAGFSIPLPLWNQNRGNISAAQSMVKMSRNTAQQKALEVATELQSAMELLYRSIREYRKAFELYNSDFEIVYNGISDNFRKRNISIIEFVDFIESYNESVSELQRIKTQLNLATEQINYTTSSEIY